MSRKILVRLSIVLMICIAVFCAGGYLYSLNGNSLDFGNTDTRVVVSGSMDGEPRSEYDIETIPVGSMVFIHEVPDGPYAYDFYSSLRIGDVVTFHYKNPVTRENMVVTHRIIDISDSSGDIKFTMAGDAIRDDPTNTSKQVVYASSGDMIGKVVGVSPVLGDITVFISSATGKAVLIGIFAALLAVIWVGPTIFRSVMKRHGSNESMKESD